MIASRNSIREKLLLDESEKSSIIIINVKVILIALINSIFMRNRKDMTGIKCNDR